MVIKNPRYAGVCAAAALVALPVPGWCAFGAFMHGHGIKSLGFAGIGIVLAEDTYTISINPANVAALDRREGYGVDIEYNGAKATVHGNLFGPASTSKSHMNVFAIPMLGVSFPIGDALSMGFTGFFADSPQAKPVPGTIRTRRHGRRSRPSNSNK